LASIQETVEYNSFPGACANVDPEYLTHINTPILARDLDLVRNLTGAEVLNYMGWDDGNMIAVTYAALFPENVGRMVLDGTLHPYMANRGLTDFSLFMGISGNVLDSCYDSVVDIPIVLSEWASQCVAAYKINETSCAFAGKSIKTSNATVDILARIESITNGIATNTRSFAYVPNSISDWSATVTSLLSSPGGWSALSQYLVALEQDLADYVPPPIQNYQWPSEYNLNLTLSSYYSLGEPPYSVNSYVYAAVRCVDASLEGISTTETFAQYIQNQISQNTFGAILAYEEVFGFSMCLTWPNATLNHAEVYHSAFPSSVKNKILMIGETYTSFWRIGAGIVTYEYVGSQNAVWLTHDAIGDGVYWDPNNCTQNTISRFLLSGITLKVKAD
jgi:alpha/beta hydrolase fold